MSPRGRRKQFWVVPGRGLPAIMRAGSTDRRRPGRGFRRRRVDPGRRQGNKGRAPWAAMEDGKMNRDTGPIVSSAHLVSEKSAELSEFEFGLMIASEAFNRWVVRCMGAAGVRDLSTLDVVVLHSVNH